MSIATTETTTTSSESAAELIPSLPDDVASNCLARIPRWYHPTLSIVSKPIRSLLSSPFFFTTRSLLNSTQHSLYLTIRSPENRSTWFTLYHNPKPTAQNDDVHLLVPIPPLPLPAVGAAYVVAGPDIYVLGGSINDAPSSNVWVLDCRFHTWRAGPPMRVAREFAAAGVVDGKIYVIGGCVTDSWSRSEYWAEALDLDTGVWEAVPSPIEVRGKWMHASAVIGGRVYALADRGGVAYDPRTRVWEGVEKRLDMGWRGRACVVHGMLYCYDYLGKIRGFDSKNRVWKELKGVEKRLPKFLCGATMANVGEKLLVLWETKAIGKSVEIWGAEIEVEENGDGELWGNIDWSQKLLSVPKHSSIVQCSAVDV